MNKLKESILNDAKNGSRDTTNISNKTTSPATDASNETTGTGNETTGPANYAITIRSNGAYIYSVATLAVLAISVCVFFAYKTSQAANKSQVNEK